VLHHVTLWVPDLARAQRSWGWLLGELGYTLDPTLGSVLLFRHPDGFAVALEESPDMVPGTLYSRWRPGLNHLAFPASTSQFERVVEAAGANGWVDLPNDHHPIAGETQVAYLEDRDGFEVELVVAAVV
jgi:catechol 2,3-dioxygenase-like lactoylglutathione lyase family enzyme